MLNIFAATLTDLQPQFGPEQFYFQHTSFTNKYASYFGEQIIVVPRWDIDPRVQQQFQSPIHLAGLKLYSQRETNGRAGHLFLTISLWSAPTKVSGKLESDRPLGLVLPTLSDPTAGEVTILALLDLAPVWHKLLETNSSLDVI